MWTEIVLFILSALGLVACGKEFSSAPAISGSGGCKSPGWPRAKSRSVRGRLQAVRVVESGRRCSGSVAKNVSNCVSNGDGCR
jgi:hypothetical protein